MEAQPRSPDYSVRVPASTGMIMMTLTVLFFQIVNKFVLGLQTPKSVSEKELWKWRNLVVSWIHAVIVGVWDLTCFYREPEMFDDLLMHYSMYSYALLAFTTGYFLYDFLEHVKKQNLMATWEVTGHHILIIFMFGYNTLTCQHIAYNVFVLITEINSIFLHQRKLCQMANYDFKSTFYRITISLNLVTFICGRFASLVAIYYGIFTYHHTVSSIHYYTLVTVVVPMTVLNIVLFYRLVKNDVFRNISYFQGKTKNDSEYMNGDVDNKVNNNIKHKAQ